jgi:hypothetical protein
VDRFPEVRNLSQVPLLRTLSTPRKVRARRRPSVLGRRRRCAMPGRARRPASYEVDSRTLENQVVDEEITWPSAPPPAPAGGA